MVVELKFVEKSIVHSSLKHKNMESFSVGIHLMMTFLTTLVQPSTFKAIILIQSSTDVYLPQSLYKKIKAVNYLKQNEEHRRGTKMFPFKNTIQGFRKSSNID